LEAKVAIHTSYSKARANLASLLTAVTDDNELVLINRRDAEDVALISSSELSSLLETVHLLRSPKNARRLLAALNRASEQTDSTTSLEQLKAELSFE
jgi:antitoxin YefM